MRQSRIKAIFGEVFNHLPNPIFCYPLLYFQHGNFICEVAAANKLSNVWNGRPRYVDARLILEGLFCDDGYFITVLEKVGDTYERRIDLDEHIVKESELNSFINKRLN